MPDTKNPGLRLRLLDECLQRRQKIWTPAQLFEAVADKFWEATGRKFSKSQFNLDIKALRDEYGAPLAHTRDQGYHYTEPGFSILGSPLVQADAAVLRQVLGLLQQFDGLGLGDELHELARRVEGHLQAPPDATPARQLISFEQVPAYAGTPFLQPIYAAIQRRQAVQLQYRPFGMAEARLETVHPQHLKEFNQRWFLLALSSARPGISHFALDRLEAVCEQPGVAYQAADIWPDAYFGEVIGASAPGDEVPVQAITLRFYNGRGHYVRTKPLHSSQQLLAEQANENELDVSLRLRPTRELETRLLEFGEDVEVLAPAGLRQRIQGRLQTALARYC